MTTTPSVPPTTLPDRVELIEVGLRDGLQTLERTVPTEHKRALIEALAASGLRSLQVASFVHPRLVPQMADAEATAASPSIRAG
jgi:hydroxymethylglutaryl-CoA lyase